MRNLHSLKVCLFCIIFFAVISISYFVISSGATHHRQRTSVTEVVYAMEAKMTHFVLPSDDTHDEESADDAKADVGDPNHGDLRSEEKPGAREQSQPQPQPQPQVPQSRAEAPVKFLAPHGHPKDQDQWNYLKMAGNANKKPIVFSEKETETTQQQRQRHMTQVCEEIFDIPAIDFDSKLPFDNLFSSNVLFNTLVNDDFKMTVTVICKVGSSNWRRFMSDLRLKSSQEFMDRWPSDRSLYKRSEDEAKYCLKHYTKILFVRNPLVRLLSAFRDRFVKLPTSDDVSRANKMIRAVRQREPANLNMPDLSFVEFLTYITLDYGKRYGNPHWRPMFRSYKPCHMRYDFIGKIETLPQDIEYLINKLGLKGVVEYGYPNPYTGSSNVTLLLEHYSQVPPKIVEKICAIYEDDFIAFDYPMPDDFSNLKTYMEKAK